MYTFLNTGRRHIEIGNNVGISHAAITTFNRVKIEDNVLVDSNCMIYDSDFYPVSFLERMESPDTRIKSEPV